MSTSKEYLNFLLDQLSSLDGISHRMMMGEYLIYYRGKVAAYICDERFLVRPVPSAIKMLPKAEYDSISEGGRKKLLRVDDVDDRELLTNLFIAMYDELPEPKPKKKKANKNSQ
ncbi:MAG: competence protein TfoX [Eubacterium sp.]|nr:competence protein TfoX [Eubacterium sp.]